MPELIDINGSFEDGWRHAVEDDVRDGWHYMRHPLDGETGNQSFKLPHGWVARWADDSIPNEYGDGQPWNQFVAPEFDLKHVDQFPDHEKVFFVRDGEWTFKPFKDHAWRAELMTTVFLDPGSYEFTVNVYPDLVASYKDGEKVWATDRPGFIYFFNAEGDFSHVEATPGKWMTRTLTFDVLVAQKLLFGLGFICPWSLKNSGWFCDNWTLERVEDIDYPVNRLLPRHRAFIDDLSEVSPLEEFHCEVQVSVLLAGGVDRYDVRVVDA